MGMSRDVLGGFDEDSKHYVSKVIVLGFGAAAVLLVGVLLYMVLREQTLISASYDANGDVVVPPSKLKVSPTPRITVTPAGSYFDQTYN